jgi:hypothetical protein
MLNGYNTACQYFTSVANTKADPAYAVHYLNDDGEVMPVKSTQGMSVMDGEETIKRFVANCITRTIGVFTSDNRHFTSASFTYDPINEILWIYNDLDNLIHVLVEVKENEFRKVANDLLLEYYENLTTYVTTRSLVNMDPSYFASANIVCKWHDDVDITTLMSSLGSDRSPVTVDDTWNKAIKSSPILLDWLRHREDYNVCLNVWLELKAPANIVVVGLDKIWMIRLR